MNNKDKKEKLNTDLKGIDERLISGWHVCIDQRKRYFKSIMKDKKKGNFFCMPLNSKKLRSFNVFEFVLIFCISSMFQKSIFGTLVCLLCLFKLYYINLLDNLILSFDR